jgi:hypothetical protein
MNTCVVCGREIPEGRQVCCTCEKNSLLNMGDVPFEDDAVTVEKFGEEK